MSSRGLLLKSIQCPAESHKFLAELKNVFITTVYGIDSIAVSLFMKRGQKTAYLWQGQGMVDILKLLALKYHPLCAIANCISPAPPVETCTVKFCSPPPPPRINM